MHALIAHWNVCITGVWELCQWYTEFSLVFCPLTSLDHVGNKCCVSTIFQHKDRFSRLDQMGRSISIFWLLCQLLKVKHKSWWSTQTHQWLCVHVLIMQKTRRLTEQTLKTSLTYCICLSLIKGDSSLRLTHNSHRNYHSLEINMRTWHLYTHTRTHTRGHR